MSTRKKDTPNWGGNALGTTGVGELTPMSKDSELKYKDRRKPDTSPDAEHSVGGPKVKSTVVSEPRSSIN